jgi:tungstate transport system permease protein
LTDIATLWTALGSREFWQIVTLSLAVSVSATMAAIVIGLPAGVALAVWRFRGRAFLIGAANAFLGLPPVVVGLALYLLLSHSGPLGFLDLLFTPAAMVVAQAVLAFPIVVALAHRAGEELWAEYGDSLLVFGGSRCRAVPILLNMGRGPMLTAALAGFGRTVSEVGAILIVGGNIAGYTRTMTTAIALETSKGELALALALGMILLAITFTLNLGAFATSRFAQRAAA